MSWSQIFFQLTVSKLRMRGTTGIKQSHNKIQNAIAGNYDYNTGAKVTTKTTCVVQVPDFAAYVAHPQKHPSTHQSRSSCISVRLSACLPGCLSDCLSVRPSVRPSFCISSWIYLSIYLSIHPSIDLSSCLSIHPSICWCCLSA